MDDAELHMLKTAYEVGGKKLRGKRSNSELSVFLAAVMTEIIKHFSEAIPALLQERIITSWSVWLVGRCPVSGLKVIEHIYFRYSNENNMSRRIWIQR